MKYSQEAWGYLFLLPWLVGFVGLTAGPMLASLWLSFTNYNFLQTPSFVGPANYRNLVANDPRFLHSLTTTLVYAVTSVPLALAAALFVAVALNRSLRGITFFRAAYYMPSILGGSVAIAILWRQVFGTGGLLNQLLALIHIQGPSWIGSPNWALWTIVVLHIWQFGSPMVIFLAGLKQVPRELYDAATVDGARRVSTFLHVTLPLLTPLILFNLVLQMIVAFHAFTPAFIISGGTGGPADSTLFYTLYLYIQGFGQLHMGYAAAMAWLLLVVIAIVTAVLFSSSRYWVHYAD